ncbi:MAG: acetyl-coenzyme A synthetase N-terminal domain-containing protein, partial [Psychrobacter sp.]
MTQQSFPIAAEFTAAANTTAEQYRDVYEQSIASPTANDEFWAERAELIDWIKKPTKIGDVNYNLNDFRIKWFEDGQLNISVNCLDRHLKKNPYKPAIIWEGDHPSLHKIIS